MNSVKYSNSNSLVILFDVLSIFIFLKLQIMRETLIYLSHLDHDDTEKQVQCDLDDNGACTLICEILRINSWGKGCLRMRFSLVVS